VKEMNVISLKDYAKQNNVSYEAVRQQVVRYADELGDHIIRDGRQQFLDEEAVAFLDSKRQKNPVVVIQQDKDEQIEQLRQEKEALLTKLAALSEWKADKAVAIAEANHRQQLIEEGKERIKALEAQNAVLSADSAEKDKTIEDERKNAQEALQELTKAHNQFEDELRRVNEAHVRELEAEQRRADSARAYAAELEAWMKLPWLKRIRTPKPVQPADRLDN